MLEVLIVSIGIVLVIEGLLYFILADRIDYFIKVLKNFNKQKIKSISLTVAFLGLCLIYFTFKVYNDFE